MSQKKFEILDTKTHKDLRVDTSNFDIEANRTNRASIVVSELRTLANEYPIFVAKNSQDGRYTLLALLGFETNENLFLKDKAWNATYIPLDVLRRPFQVYLPEGTDQYDGPIAIDRSSPQVQGTYGQTIFDEEGKPSTYLEYVQQLFAELMNRTKETQLLAEKLDEMGLLKAGSLTVPSRDGNEFKLTGLYSVDEKSMLALSGEALETAHKDGTLLAASLMMNSLCHIDKLISWRQEKLREMDS